MTPERLEELRRVIEHDGVRVSYGACKELVAEIDRLHRLEVIIFADVDRIRHQRYIEDTLAILQRWVQDTEAAAQAKTPPDYARSVTQPNGSKIASPEEVQRRNGA